MTTTIKTVQVTPRLFKGDQGSPIYLGMLLEDDNSKLVSAACRDLISYSRVVNPRNPLTVITNIPSVLKHMQASVSFEVEQYTPFLSGNFNELPEDIRQHLLQCKVWKAYWYSRKFNAPPTAEHFYETRVFNPNVEKIVIRKDDPRYPCIDRPNDERIVPPGLSPSINKIPPRGTGSPSLIPNFFW